MKQATGPHVVMLAHRARGGSSVQLDHPLQRLLDPPLDKISPSPISWGGGGFHRGNNESFLIYCFFFFLIDQRYFVKKSLSMAKFLV